MQKIHREVRNFIGGEWVEGNGRETEPVYDPATEEVIAETPLSTKEDVDRAVKAASAAFKDWAATPVIQRIQVLFRYKMLLEEHFEELRDLVTLENGERFGESLRQETMAFIEVMRGERENPSPPAAAMEALRVAVACEVSREEERPVRVAEIRDDPMGS